MKKALKVMVGAGVAALHITLAQAHTLWINVVPEFDRHVITTIGYGEVVPGSELLTPDWWPMYIESYELYAPSGEKTALEVPKLVTQDKKALKSGLQVQPGGDTGQQKFIINDKTAKGTYQLTAKTPLAHVVGYLDKKGKKQYADASFMKLPKGAQIISEKYGINFMQAVFAVGDWTSYKPTGLPLEILPLSNLHDVRVGDRIKFQILLNGKPMTNEGPYIAAYNSSFGDRWGLHADIIDGFAEIRITEAGSWRIDTNYSGSSDEIDAYRDLKKLPISMESSLVFTVRP